MPGERDRSSVVKRSDYKSRLEHLAYLRSIAGKNRAIIKHADKVEKMTDEEWLIHAAAIGAPFEATKTTIARMVDDAKKVCGR